MAALRAEQPRLRIEDYQHTLGERGMRLPLIAFDEWHRVRLNPGARLELVNDDDLTLVTRLDDDGLTKVVGRLGATVAEPELWAASVVLPDKLEVRLIPFKVRDCGCVENLGGYVVRWCDPHGAEADQVEVRGQGGDLFDEYTGDPRAEQETVYRRVV